jgi:protein-S-isoprenylcysteine O-methyltransferase Ste14
VTVSWRSLKSPRVHGFYRFFAFELILALTLLNAKYWFADAACVRQITSWFLLTWSAVLAGHSFYLLWKIGNPRRRSTFSGNLPFENTTKLVRIGAFRYTRHPLYASLLFLVWGVFLKHPSLSGVLLSAAASAFLYCTARVEERENLRVFGDEYMSYMKTTKLFIPYLF